MREADREGPAEGTPVRDPLHQGQTGGGASGLTARGRRSLTLYAAAAAVYAVDRITKILAERLLDGGPPIELIPGVLQLRYTTNPGGAFGLFGGVPWLFVSITLVVTLAIVVASRHLPSTASAVGLGLVLGGALGNLTDRGMRGPGFGGEVIDFVDLHIWPVFNLADTAIVVGAGVLILQSILRERAERRRKRAGGIAHAPEARCTQDATEARGEREAPG